jgi:hypothetical protein
MLVNLLTTANILSKPILSSKYQDDFLMEKARIAKVKFAADLEIECLMLPDGSFGIGVSQIASVFSFLNHNLSRDVKALLGDSFQFLKTTSELNPKVINYITLQQFVSVCRALDKKGNELAGRLIEIHLEASFTSIVCSAFGVKFTQDDLIKKVEFRSVHLKGYHPKFTRWLKQDGVTGMEYGVRCNELKRKVGLPLLPVDDYDKDELAKMNLAEAMYDRLRCKGLNHEDAFDLV